MPGRSPSVVAEMHDTAAECFLALQDENLTQSTRDHWLRWLRLRSQHQLAFDEICELWGALERVGPVPLPSPGDLCADPGIDDTPVTTSARGDGVPAAIDARPRLRSVIRPLMGIAAAVLVLVGAVAISGAWRELFHQKASFQTAVAQIRTVRLPDESSMTLGGDTLVEMDYSGRQRALRIVRGEALFSVQKDAERPFTVRAGEGVTTAIGTQFDVNKIGDRVVVTVVQGFVKVQREPADAMSAQENERPRAQRGSTLLGQGEQVTYSNRSLGPVATLDAQQAISWKSGVLIFVDEPLGRAIDAVNRYRKRQIYFRSEDIEGLRITGNAYVDRTDEWLKGLEEGYGLTRIEGDEGRILLTRRARGSATQTPPSPTLE